MKGLKNKVPCHTLLSQQGFDNGDNSNYLKSVMVIIENINKKPCLGFWSDLLHKESHKTSCYRAHCDSFWDKSEQNSRHGAFFWRNQNFEEKNLQSSRFLKTDLELTKKGYFTTR